MDSTPQLNIKLKWQLFGSFFLAFLLPAVLWLVAAPAWTIVLAAIGATALLAWYVGSLFASYRQFVNLASHLNARQGNGRGESREELSELLTAFKDFQVELGEAFDPDEGQSDGPAEYSESKIALAARGRAVFSAGLASGDAVVGEAAALPRRGEEELQKVAYLAGKDALKLFRDAVTSVKEQLTQLRDVPELNEAEKGIIEFQRLLLEDPSLLKGVETCLADQMDLHESVSTTFVVMTSKLESSKNAYIAARVADCLDLKQRLMETIARRGLASDEEFYSRVAGKIIFCQQIFPSEVIMLHQGAAAGIAVSTSTPSSHAEILMQSFNIPSLANIENLPVHVLKGRQVLLDTLHKRLIIDPDENEVDDLAGRSPLDPKLVIREPVTLRNGEPVTVCATINNISVEAERAGNAGADGVGLFRSEMSFIGRQDLPTEEQLFEEYRQLTESFSEQPVSMRMLDLGSDKLASFQQQDYEENPCMGNRSMRLLIRRTDIFRNQLRAMLRAATPETCILFPMISGWHELKKIQSLIQRIHAELQAENEKMPEKVRYGLMVEVPSIVERFEDYVTEFDEFNIGTNDLTQYSLAADRNNEQVAEYYKSYHPSLLSMIRRVCRLGAKHGKKVCLCGEMANDLFLIPLLLGLGVRHFSVPYACIPDLKRMVREVDFDTCCVLADQALQRRSTDEMESLLVQYSYLRESVTVAEKLAVGEAASAERVERVRRQEGGKTVSSLTPANERGEDMEDPGELPDPKDGLR